jgi:hypothetical protein
MSRDAAVRAGESGKPPTILLSFYLTACQTFWHSIWHSIWHIFWHILFGILYGIFSDFLALVKIWRIFWHSISGTFWKLAFYLTYLGAYFLRVYLSNILTLNLAFYLAYIARFYVAFYLAFYLTVYLTNMLSFRLSEVHPDILPEIYCGIFWNLCVDILYTWHMFWHCIRCIICQISYTYIYSRGVCSTSMRLCFCEGRSFKAIWKPSKFKIKCPQVHASQLVFWFQTHEITPWTGCLYCL